MRKTVNHFEKVTNISVSEFRRNNDNGTYTDMVEVVLARYSSDSVKVYNFKLASGSVNERRVNLVYKHTDPVKFEEQYIRYWYALEKIALTKEYNDKYSKEVEDEEFKVKAEVVKARYDHAMKCLEGFGNVDGIPNTVKLLVLCDRKAKDELFPEAILRDYGKVETALNDLNKIDSDSEAFAAGMKSLREAINKYLCPHVWVKSDDGTISKYIFRCNARLADDVYRVNMEGRARNREGKIGSVYARSDKMLREVVYACFEELQNK